MTTTDPQADVVTLRDTLVNAIGQGVGLSGLVQDWLRDRLDALIAATRADATRAAAAEVAGLAEAVLGNGWLMDGRCRYCSRIDPEHRACPVPIALGIADPVCGCKHARCRHLAGTCQTCDAMDGPMTGSCSGFALAVQPAAPEAEPERCAFVDENVCAKWAGWRVHDPCDCIDTPHEPRFMCHPFASAPEAEPERCEECLWHDFTPR